MRHTLRNFGLLGLGLLLSVFVIKFVNAENELIIDLSNTVQHSSRLYNLNLGSGTVGTLKVATVPGSTAKRATFTNGLIIGDNHTVSVDSDGHAVIGGGSGNTVTADFAAVGGGADNKSDAEYAVIGGGQKNIASQENSVVVGGFNNQAGGKNSVVVGGQGNNALEQNSVVVGGQGNKANKNSLVLGKSSIGNEGSFAWNASATAKNGSISATNGVLVNTTTKIDGVNLVVNGAIKIGGPDSTLRHKGEIRYVGKCFYAYDGSKWYVLNRGSENGGNTQCNDFPGETAKYCNFGNTVLQNGDTGKGYSQPYAAGLDNACDAYEHTVTCNNGTLSPSGYTYPYCYVIHN